MAVQRSRHGEGAPRICPILEQLKLGSRHIGAEDRRMELLERQQAVGFGVATGAWFPAMPRRRKDYWRERGWPNLCQTLPTSYVGSLRIIRQPQFFP